MKKNIEAVALRYRLPETTTPENLECMWSKTLTFGNFILSAGNYFNGPGQNNYYGIIYTFTTDDHTCEGEIRIVAISDEFFEDQGHAIAWAIANAK